MRVEGATVHKAQCTAAAAVGIDAPQFESFYTVPLNYETYV